MLQQLLTDRLTEIKLRPGILSDKTKALIEAATKDADPEIRAAAETIEDLYDASLAKINLAKAGEDQARSLVRGFVDHLGERTVGETIADAIRRAFDDPGNFFRGLIPAPTPTGGRRGLLEFAVGTPFVPADMLAILHRGEMVIPAAESAAIRAGSSPTFVPASAGDRNQNIYIDQVTIEDASDERSLVDRLRFLNLAGA